MPNLALVVLALVVFVAPAHADRRVTLNWNANTETDLGGYQVYRHLGPCAQAVEGTTLTLLQAAIDKTKTTYPDATIPDAVKVVCFGIKAFDTSNNVSPMSNLAEKTFTPPVLLGHWLQKTDVAHDPKYNLKRYTIHAVVRPKAALTVFSPLLVKNYTYFLYAASKGYCGDGGILAGIPSVRVCDPTPLVPNVWTALTATYDGANVALYKNRSLLKSAPVPEPVDSTEPLQIAGSKFNESCNCDLEVWLYDHAMTPTEVAALPLASTVPVIHATPMTLAFNSTVGGTEAPAQTITVTGTGWAVTSTQPWLHVVPHPGSITVTTTHGTLSSGPHLGAVDIHAPGAVTVTIPVTFTVINAAPAPPSQLRISGRPTTDSVLVAWNAPVPLPETHSVLRLNQTTGNWVPLASVAGTVTEAEVPLPPAGRRLFRVCAVRSNVSLCPVEGVWAAK